MGKKVMAPSSTGVPSTVTVPDTSAIPDPSHPAKRAQTASPANTRPTRMTTPGRSNRFQNGDETFRARGLVPVLKPVQKFEITSPPSIFPRACQVARETEFRTNRTDPSAIITLTPPECRLRAALYWLPAVLTGMSGSLSMIAQLTTSNADELGVVM